VLSLIASGALLVAGMAIVYERMNWRDIAVVWANLDPKLVAIAVIVYWLQYPIISFRLHRVILWTTGKPSADAPSLGFVFKLASSAGFVAVAAPIGLAGDAAKIAALRVFGSLSTTDAARCALFDRVVGVQWICVFGLVAIPLQISAGVDGMIVIQLALFVALIAGVGVLLLLPRILALVRHEFVSKLAQVFAGYRVILAPGRSAIQLVISLLGLISAWGTLYLLLRAAGLTVDAWLVAGFVPLLQLVNGLPFLYMGWGGRELAMVATLGAAGSLSASEALAVSIAWGVVLVITGVVNGVFLLGDWQIARADSVADNDQQ